ncbi:MAG: ATP-dependent endonuclease [Planctomycetota bacterium]
MDPPDFCDVGPTARPALTQQRRLPLLCVVEGRHDVEFLRRLSATLARSDSTIPDLGQLERTGHLVFIPFGGGDVLAWSERFAPLGCPEFHLYDREILPETLARQAAVARVNNRAKCWAFLTTKRSLENYLHPLTLVRAGGSSLEFGDNDSVASCVARQSFQSLSAANDWNQLPRRARARFANRAKRWLNTVAVEHLTPELLAARDPHGELVGWLRTIAGLLEQPRRTTAV